MALVLKSADGKRQEIPMHKSGEDSSRSSSTGQQEQQYWPAGAAVLASRNGSTGQQERQVHCGTFSSHSSCQALPLIHPHGV
jgi:hypothetical protein